MSLFRKSLAVVVAAIAGFGLGAAPTFAQNEQFIPRLVGLDVPVNLVTNLQTMIFGALIIIFLIVEPNGLARLWVIGKEKLRLWPFPH